MMAGHSISRDGAPIVDDALAATLRDVKDPTEKLSADQGMAFFLQTVLGSGICNLGSRPRRLVQLECGHFKLTGAIRETACPRCGAMIRAGYDYHAFRELGERDEFSWPKDPLRAIHEKHRETV